MEKSLLSSKMGKLNGINIETLNISCNSFLLHDKQVRTMTITADYGGPTLPGEGIYVIPSAETLSVSVSLVWPLYFHTLFIT